MKLGDSGEGKALKRMTVKEFREIGFFQELNRQFLHPLGLALEVSVDLDGDEFISGIWDYRHDEEGIIYALSDSTVTSPERLESFREKSKRVEDHWTEMATYRTKKLGFMIEPILCTLVVLFIYLI